MERIGIIGAMDEEIIELRGEMNISEEVKIGSFTYYVGTLEEKNVVLVGSGIGKVNSAICASLLIERFKVTKIIFTGVAGAVSNSLNIGDIVISDELIEHDFDCTAFGMNPGVIPRMDNSNFKSDSKLVEIAKSAVSKILDESKVKVGTIVSGDQFIASKEKITWLETTYNALCTEMEGASVAHVCYVLNIPFVVIRAISDKADGSAHVDFKEFVKIAASNSKNVVNEMLLNI